MRDMPRHKSGGDHIFENIARDMIVAVFLCHTPRQVSGQALLQLLELVFFFCCTSTTRSVGRRQWERHSLQDTRL